MSNCIVEVPFNFAKSTLRKLHIPLDLSWPWLLCDLLDGVSFVDILLLSYPKRHGSLRLHIVSSRFIDSICIMSRYLRLNFLILLLKFPISFIRGCVSFLHLLDLSHVLLLCRFDRSLQALGRFRWHQNTLIEHFWNLGRHRSER